MKVFQSKSLDEQRAFVKSWLADIYARKSNDGATIVGLSGHLGAGKTALVKSVAKELGIDEEVTSPTFVLMKIYEINNSPFKRLIHIDAYRLEKREELEALRFEDVINDSGNLVIIEWPENVGLNKDDLNEMLKFEIKDGTYTIQF